MTTLYPPRKIIAYKDTQANLDFGFDWSTKWLELGETISTSVWTISPSGDITQSNESVVAGITTVWLSGGQEGTNYEITNQIITNRGRIDERTFILSVISR